MFKPYNIVWQAVSGKLPASQSWLVSPALATMDDTAVAVINQTRLLQMQLGAAAAGKLQPFAGLNYILFSK